MEEIATFEYGYTISASDRGEFRFIRITDLDEYGNISDQDKKYIDLTNEADKEKYLLKENDIIMARIGSVGETAIFFSREKSIFASYLIRINLNQKILPEYYGYFTKTLEYGQQVEQLTKGTVQPQFNANSLKEIQVPIPSLEKQQEIIREREKDLLIINHQNQSINLLKEKQQKFGAENLNWGVPNYITTIPQYKNFTKNYLKTSTPLLSRKLTRALSLSTLPVVTDFNLCQISLSAE